MEHKVCHRGELSIKEMVEKLKKVRGVAQHWSFIDHNHFNHEGIVYGYYFDITLRKCVFQQLVHQLRHSYKLYFKSRAGLMNITHSFYAFGLKLD